MDWILPALPCTPEQHEMLMSLARGQKVQARLKERTRIVLRDIDGAGIKDTAKEMGFDKDTVSQWRCRFLSARARRASRALNCANASWPDWSWSHQKDLATGTAPWLASTLGVPAWRVWDILRIEGI